MGLWSLFLAYPNWLKTRKWYLLVLLIPWVVVTIDVLLISNPSFAEIVCSARIWDARPDLIVILAAALPLTFYIGITLDMVMLLSIERIYLTGGKATFLFQNSVEFFYERSHIVGFSDL